MEAMEIARTGLDVEWMRLQVVTQNIANINSSRSADGTPYVARRLISGPAQAFSTALTRQGAPSPGTARGVAVYEVRAEAGAVKRVYSPSHPDADAAGFVTMPDISTATEMTEMIKASRAYEANLIAFSAAQQMYSSALRLGQGR